MTTTGAPPPLAAGVAPPHSLAAEEAVLGAVLLSSKCFGPLRLEEGLEAAHFYREQHRAIFEAMQDLHSRGDAIDTLTVAAELERRGVLSQIGGKATIDQLTGGVPMLSAYRTYAGVVTQNWKARTRLASAYEQQAVILNHGSEDDYQAALARAHAVVASGVSDGYLGHDALANHMLQWMEAPKEDGLPTPTELPSLADMVLLRPGHVTIIAAFPSAGKTATALAMAAAIGSKGLRVGIWTNEDGPEELVAKHVQSATGIPASVITKKRTDDERMPKVLAAIARLPFEVQPCHGWTAQQVATHMTQTALPVTIVDHFHNLKGISTVAEVDESIRVLAAAAGQCRTHLILCAQLNRNRLNGVCKPPPVISDLRGSGMFEAAAHTMLLIHRDEEEIEDDEHGKLGKARKLDTGSVDVAKNKVTGQTGVIAVEWDAQRLRFVEATGERSPW